MEGWWTAGVMLGSAALLLSCGRKRAGSPPPEQSKETREAEGGKPAIPAEPTPEPKKEDTPPEPKKEETPEPKVTEAAAEGDTLQPLQETTDGTYWTIGVDAKEQPTQKQESEPTEESYYAVLGGATQLSERKAPVEDPKKEEDCKADGEEAKERGDREHKSTS